MSPLRMSASVLTVKVAQWYAVSVSIRARKVMASTACNITRKTVLLGHESLSSVSDYAGFIKRLQKSAPLDAGRLRRKL